MTNAPHVTPTEARQASPRRLNLRVLVASMLLAVIVAAILYYALYQTSDNRTDVLDPAPATQSESVNP